MKNLGIIGAAALAIIGFVAFSQKSGNTPPAKYSEKWMEALSDKELDEEREKARLEYLKSGSRAILDIFDAVIRKRRYKDTEPGFPVHREHGWYLSNDD